MVGFLVSIRCSLEKDVFSLYFRPRDVILENSFFPMSSYALAYAHITYGKTKCTRLRGVLHVETVGHLKGFPHSLHG